MPPIHTHTHAAAQRIICLAFLSESIPQTVSVGRSYWPRPALTRLFITLR